MPSVLLALVGPAQSWGTSSRFSIRDAGTEPSKSGVIGLVASALGRSRSESIEDLAALRMGVRIDAEGVVQRDYQTALGAIRADGSANKDAVVSTRYFLADAAFLVALEGEQTVIEALDRALLAPRWPLFLGRKAFPPTTPVARGIADQDVEGALATGAWTAPSGRDREQTRIRLEAGEAVSVRTVVEVPPDHATEFRDDQPISFEPRRFTRRAVRIDSVPLSLGLLQRPTVLR